MTYVGTVMKNAGKTAYILTVQLDVVAVRQREDMVLGRQVCFTDEEIIKSASSAMEPEEKLAKKFANGIPYALRNAAMAFVVAVMILCALLILNRPSLVIRTGDEPLLFASVSLDVNPSISWELDQDGTVLRCRPLGADAQALSVDYGSLSGQTAGDAARVLMRALIEQGYVRENSEILFSFAMGSGADEAQYHNIKKQITDAVRGQSGSAPCRVIGVFDDALLKQAVQGELSAARQMLRSACAGQGIHMPKQTLLGMSVHELNQALNGYEGVLAMLVEPVPTIIPPATVVASIEENIPDPQADTPNAGPGSDTPTPAQNENPLNNMTPTPPAEDSGYGPGGPGSGDGSSSSYGPGSSSSSSSSSTSTTTATPTATPKPTTYTAPVLKGTPQSNGIHFTWTAAKPQDELEYYELLVAPGSVSDMSGFSLLATLDYDETAFLVQEGQMATGAGSPLTLAKGQTYQYIVAAVFDGNAVYYSGTVINTLAPGDGTATPTGVPGQATILPSTQPPSETTTPSESMGPQ